MKQRVAWHRRPSVRSSLVDALLLALLLRNRRSAHPPPAEPTAPSLRQRLRRAYAEALRDLLRHVKDLGAQWITIFGTGATVAVYLVLRASTARFYAHFGLTLEDVGLGESTLLARSALCLLLLVLLSALTGLPMMLGFIVGCTFPAQATRTPVEESQWNRLARSVIIPGVGSILAAIIVVILVRRTTLSIIVVAVAVIFAMAAAYFGLGLIVAALPSLRGRRVPTWLVVLFASALVVVLPALGLWKQAGADARSAQEGFAPATLYGVPMYAYSATPVFTDDHNCLLYLGASSGAVFLYDPDTKRVLHRADATRFDIKVAQLDSCS